MTICILLLFCKRSFHLGSILFLENSFDDLHLGCCFGRGVFNSDLTFSYKFLWRSASGSLFGREVFNCHLSFSYRFLWRSASSYSFGIGIFKYNLSPFPINSYDDSASGYSLEEEFSNSIYSFPTNSLWRSASGYSLEEEFSIRISPFPTNSYDDLHLATLWKRRFQLEFHLFLQIPVTICILLFFGIGSFQFGPHLFL